MPKRISPNPPLIYQALKKDFLDFLTALLFAYHKSSPLSPYTPFSSAINHSYHHHLHISTSTALHRSVLTVPCSVAMGQRRKAECSVSCTTFNILAPIYKRLDHEDQSCRESQYKAYWLSRNQRIIDRLLEDCSSIICLQEVWLGNEELVDMYEKRLGDAGYITFKLARTNNRGDGLLTALHRDNFRVLNHNNVHFNDFGDRVAQLLHVESVVPFWPYTNNSEIKQQMLIVNTHLIFPHDYSLCIIRLKQVYNILQCIESYQKQHQSPMPIVLCGDWNGSKRGHVYKFLRSQGFVSSYDTAHHYTDSDADAHKWVSHRNHRGNICGVDFIWLLNPNKHRKPLKTSWNDAVFAIIKGLLQGASLSEENAFESLKADSSDEFITFSGFCQALCQLGLSGEPYGLTSEEIEDLWAQADIDSDGVMNFHEFQKRIWRAKWWDQPEQSNPQSELCNLQQQDEIIDMNQQDEDEELAFGFNVKDAVLFPPEVERGLWPDNYSLSDHAPLTVVFSPVQLPCAQPVF